MTQGMIDLIIEVNGEALSLVEVPYTVEVDTVAGCRTYRNGDPGHPPMVSADVTLDWSRKEAVEAVEAWFRDRGRTVPTWVYAQTRDLLASLVSELDCLLREGRL